MRRHRESIPKSKKVAIQPDGKTKEKSVTEVRRNLERAQKLVRKYVKSSRSLSDELIAERRAEAKAEME
ncbi:MAG: hypothetical protein NVS9B14_10940 [Candidatus Acidiferrum sp.]